MAVRPAQASDGNASDLAIRSFRILNDGSVVQAFANADGSAISGGGASSPITSSGAQAFAVGPNGNTNPVFQVDASEASQVGGLTVQGHASGNHGVTLATISSEASTDMWINPKGAGIIVLNRAGSGGVQVQSGGSSNAFLVVNTTASATNPAFVIDNSTASAVTGIKIKSAATGNGVAVSTTDSGSNTGLTVDAKGSGTIVIGGTSTGLVSLGRGGANVVMLNSTTTALGTVQNSTPTAAQLLGGIVTQTGATGAGTVTLPTGTLLSTADPGVAVGDTFQCVFANLGGGQTLTITGATGATVVGTAAIGSGKNAILNFVNTGANTWNVYVIVSA